MPEERTPGIRALHQNMPGSSILGCGKKSCNLLQFAFRPHQHQVLENVFRINLNVQQGFFPAVLYFPENAIQPEQGTQNVTQSTEVIQRDRYFASPIIHITQIL